MKVHALLLALAISLSSCVVLDPAAEINALMHEGQQLYSAQRFDEAIARFRTVTTKDPNYYLAYVWLARSFLARGHWIDAIANARRAFELNPRAPDVMPVLLDALFGGGADALARGSFIESIGYLGEYLRHQPMNIRAWITVGKAYIGNRQFLDALNAFRRAIEGAGSSPERSEAIRSLLDGAKQAFNLRDYRAAMDLAREYLRFNGGDPAVTELLRLLQGR